VCGWPHPPLAVIACEFKRLQKGGVLTSLDVGPILGPVWSWADLAKVLKHTSLLLGNRHEVLALTGRRRLEHALDRLRQVCPGDIVVKLGEAGAMWSAPFAAKSKRMPARKVRVINTVGAGDSFNGALLAAILRGEKMPKAIAAAVEFATQVVASSAGVLGSALPARRSF
jgi:ribokinase